MQTASFDFQMCTFDGKNVPTWPSFYSLSSDLFDLTVCPPASSQLPDREQVSDGSAKAAKSPRFAQWPCGNGERSCTGGTSMGCERRSYDSCSTQTNQVMACVCITEWNGVEGSGSICSFLLHKSPGRDRIECSKNKMKTSLLLMVCHEGATCGSDGTSGSVTLGFVTLLYWCRRTPRLAVA